MIRVEEYKKENEGCICEGKKSIIHTCGILKKVSDKEKDKGIKIEMHYNNKLEKSKISTTCWNPETISKIEIEINYCPICGKKL